MSTTVAVAIAGSRCLPLVRTVDGGRHYARLLAGSCSSGPAGALGWDSVELSGRRQGAALRGNPDLARAEIWRSADSGRHWHKLQLR